jgi:hypothetical protein
MKLSLAYPERYHVATRDHSASPFIKGVRSPSRTPHSISPHSHRRCTVPAGCPACIHPVPCPRAVDVRRWCRGCCSAEPDASVGDRRQTSLRHLVALVRSGELLMPNAQSRLKACGLFRSHSLSFDVRRSGHESNTLCHVIWWQYCMGFQVSRLLRIYIGIASPTPSLGSFCLSIDRLGMPERCEVLPTFRESVQQRSK